MAGRIDVRGLRELGQRLKSLGNEIPDRIQGVLDETASESVADMKSPMDQATDGGPTRWMAIKPGKKSSAVLPSRPRRGAQNGVAGAQVYVQKDQSAVFKYLLEHEGEDDVREPGDVGAAKEWIFVPRRTKVLAKYQGIRLNKRGNMPRSALKRLVERANIKGVKAKGRGRDEKGRFTPGEKGTPGGDVFFGKPKGDAKTRSRHQIGFWQRPAKQDGGLYLLVEAIPRADYGDLDQFDRAWNEGVEDGSKRLPERAEDAVGEALRAALRPGATRRRRAPGGPT